MTRPTLVEVADSPAGLTELKIRDSQGARIGFFQGSTVDIDDELISDLQSWAARHRHGGTTLTIIRPAESA